jgi:hypothetical protein
MRQCTTPEQTAKLIELGFEKPKNIVEGELYSDIYFAYAIGELIEMLPISFENDNDDTSWLEIEAGAVWRVLYLSFGFIDYDCERKELIDALYDMIVKLKEEGVI